MPSFREASGRHLCNEPTRPANTFGCGCSRYRCKDFFLLQRANGMLLWAAAQLREVFGKLLLLQAKKKKKKKGQKEKKKKKVCGFVHLNEQQKLNPTAWRLSLA